MLPFTRSTLGMKINNEEIDVENGRFEKDRERGFQSRRRLALHNQALLSGISYCLSSCGMILVNKYVLSSYDFNAGISLMLYQNFVAVVVVSGLSIFGIIKTEPLKWRLIKVWLPVNVIFVGMLVTSMFRYKSFILLSQVRWKMPWYHWKALDAISGGFTDLSFDATGYFVMDTAKQVTKSGELNEFSMVMLNNSLSLPLGVVLVCGFKEVDYLVETEVVNSM
ncbi:hypothetical protein SASPL_101630 [Salvia splendens]|uniref:Uncharacterized protein n=1 Tax=Salvia splendens TaxID=180675 RepID=A0A8X8YW41_SALSN|nr:hypothetical protein SASPL_101630 [Salvia splendens]